MRRSRPIVNTTRRRLIVLKRKRTHLMRDAKVRAWLMEESSRVAESET